MPFTILFIIGSISERLFNIEVGPLKLSLGDVMVLLALPYCIVTQGKIKPVFFKLSLLAFVVIFASILMNMSSYGFNTLISVPLRIVAAGVIANELVQLRRPDLWRVVCIMLYVLAVFFALFFSDGSPFKIIELFNRNEILSYSVLLILLALFCSFNHRVVSTKPLSGKHILVPFILIVVAGVIASRQNILAVLVGFLALFFFLKPKQKMIVGTMVVCFGIIVGPFVISKIASDERMSARLSTVTEFEPATRADKYRLANIIQAVEGFQRSPVFGNGPTSFKRNNQFDKVAHSTPFSALYELGLLGLLFLIAIFWNIMRFPFYLRRVLNPHPAAVIFASLMPLIVVQSFFIELLPKAPLFVYFALSIAALQVFKGSHYVHYKKA